MEGSGEPNSEFWIHARIYAARPDVGGVAHVHPPACVVLGQIGATLRPLHNSGAVPGETPLYDHAGLIRTRELGEEVAATLGGRTAMLLRGHGANVAESDVRRAIVVACLLEESARLQLDALAATGGNAGSIRFYGFEESERLRAELEGEPLARAWAYFSELAKRNLTPPS